MKIVQINAVCGKGSTGKICVGISEMLTQNQIENFILYCSGTSDYSLGIKCANDKYIKIQALKSHLFGNYGFNSKSASRKMIKELESIEPDIVHLHNIHGHDCDLETLFEYFNKRGTRLIWTFHDCWAFTGYCTHFVMNRCDKWKNGCEKCIQAKGYSWLFDRSDRLYEKKKRLFEGLNLTIVTPSRWMAELVGQSFLKDREVKVINNGVDLAVFRPVQSDFRKRNGIESKKIVLGVSFGWDERKGLDVFKALAARLPDDYKIILVGTDERVERLLPASVLAIRRTQDQTELAQIYSAADLFVNPTVEDTFPTVNMEALACGTPVLTFRTGGSPEIIDENCGSVVDCGDVDGLEKEIIRICTEKPYSQSACLSRSRSFEKNERFKEYLKLYERINASGT